jgi:uncharacterized protein YggE
MFVATNAAAAVAENHTAMSAVIAAVEAAGVAAGQIRTTNFDVGPVYVSPQNLSDAATIAGFESSNLVVVQLWGTTAVGHIIDVALAAGADQVQGVSFTLKDPSVAERRAMALAVADARQMAGATASAAGVALGPIRSIGHESSNAMYPMGPCGIGGAGTPVLPGQQTVTVTVHITFDVSRSVDRGGPVALLP